MLRRELLEEWLDADGLRPAVEVAERQAQVFVSEHVDAPPRHVGETGAAERRESAVHGRLGTAQCSGELVERDSEWMVREFDQHRDHAVGADELLLRGAPASLGSTRSTPS